MAKGFNKNEKIFKYISVVSGDPNSVTRDTELFPIWYVSKLVTFPHNVDGISYIYRM